MSVGVQETEWLQLTQLGLGKALDATKPHPWASKSSYQAKEVRLHKVLQTYTLLHRKTCVEDLEACTEFSLELGPD